MLASLSLLLLHLTLVSAVRFFTGPRASLSQSKPAPYTIFKTEPLFVPSAINVTKTPDDPSLLAPGYIFIAPHLGSNGFGPQIIDHDGNLIWYGNNEIVKIKGRRPYGMDITVCDFQGEIGTHLCWSEGRPDDAEDLGIKAGGANRIFDSHYQRVVRDFQNFGTLNTPNPHEYNVLPGGQSFLQSVYHPVQMDLTPYAGDKDGWVNNGCFQEINIRQRKAVFEWCFLDHFPVWETFLYLNTDANTVNASSGTSGKGKKGSKWDFMHLNSVDKNDEGDYLVSGRHLSQLLKIAGPNSRSGLKPGTTIWRLNGRHSDFQVEEDANFGRQHHARFISTGSEETLISMFNNAFDGVTGATRNQSAALILRLNNRTMTAKVEAMYENPDNRLSFAQGSAHVQPNGNVHVGWGSHPEWSEFTANGTLLYHAKAYIEDKDGHLTNYRSFKFPWVGRPKTNPKLVAYCQTCNMFASSENIVSQKTDQTSPLIAYVSWNGATEVASWRFSVSANYATGPWISAGVFPRDGFETRAELNPFILGRTTTFASWVSVEALDSSGTVLGQKKSRTFVPNRQMKANCSREGCEEPFRFAYELRFSQSCHGKIDWMALAIILGLLLLTLEASEGFYFGLLTSLVCPGDEDCDEKGARLYQSLNGTASDIIIEKG